MSTSLAQLIETAERSFAQNVQPQPVDTATLDHPLRQLSARLLRTAARRSLRVADRLDPTPTPA